MGKKWDKYKVVDPKWDKYKMSSDTETIEEPVLDELTTEDLEFSIDIPEESRIAYIHNNPGNLMFDKQEGAEKGEVRGKGFWAKFENPEAGFNALVKDIKGKQTGKTKTNLSGASALREFARIYVDPKKPEELNRYVSGLVSDLGVDEKTPIKDIDPVALARAVSKHESSTKISEAPVKVTEEAAAIEEVPEVPSRLEYYTGKGIGRSVLGTAIDFIQQFNPATNPTLGFDLSEGGLKQVFQDWQRKRGEESQWLDSYDPSLVDEVAAFGIGMVMDAPLFAAGGTVGRGMAKGANAMFRNLVKTGLSEEAATKAIGSGVAKIAANASTRMGSSAGALGVHGAAMNMVQQIDEGKSFDEMEYWEIVKEGGKGARLGVAIGAVGTIGAGAQRAIMPKLAGKGDIARYATLAGIKGAEFAGENAVFLYGGQILEPKEERMPITGKDWLKSVLQLGLLKAVGVTRIRPEIERNKVKGKLKNEIKLTPEELESFGEGATVESIVDNMADTAGYAKSILENKNIPISAKVKLLAGTSEKVPVPDLSTADRVDVKEMPDGTARVITKDAEGNTYEIKAFESLEEANRASMDVVALIKDKKIKDNINSLTKDEQFEVDMDLKRMGKKGLFDEQVKEALIKNPSERNPEEIKIVDRIDKTVNSLLEKREKLAETEKKISEEEKKLADKKTEISEIEKAKEIEKEKSEQKKKPVVEPGEQKIEKEVEDAGKIEKKVDEPVPEKGVKGRKVEPGRVRDLEKDRKEKVEPKKPIEVAADKPAVLRENLKADIQKSFKEGIKEGRKVTNEQFKKVSDSVVEKLKNAKTKGFITDYQYRTIVNKLGQVEKQVSEGKILYKHRKILEYVDKVISGAEIKGERTRLERDIKKILTKKRTKIARGARKMKIPRKVITKEGEEKLTKTGVDVDAFTYFEHATKTFKQIQSLSKKSKIEEKHRAGEELSEGEVKALNAARETRQAMNNEYENSLKIIAENEGKPEGKIDKEAVRKAKIYLKMSEDFGDLTKIDNESLDRIFKKLSKVEVKGVEKLSKSVENDIKRYAEIGSTVVEAVEPWMKSERFKKKIDRVRKFETARKKSLEEDKGLRNRVRWWLKNTGLRIKEGKEKALIDIIISPNAHLETTTQLLDKSKDQKLSKFITSSIAKGASDQISKTSRNSNYAFGKILEFSNEKLISDLHKKYGKKDDIIAWLYDNKKMTPKIQAAIFEGVNRRLYELKTEFTDEIQFKEDKVKIQKLTLDEGLKVYTWSKNERLAKELDKMGFTQKVINEKILPKLPKWAKEWSDWVTKDYTVEDYNQSNEVHMRTNRVPLTRVEEYFPVERHNMRADEILGKPFISEGVSSTMYSQLIDRVDSTNNPLRITGSEKSPALAFSDLFGRHIQNSEHYKVWASIAKEMDVILNHPDFKDVASVLGLERLIKYQIDVNINGTQKLANDYANTWMGRLLSRYASVQLAAKINMIPKQATSLINGIVEAENPYRWTADTMKLLLNPKEASRLWKELYAESPKFKERVDNMMLSDPDLRGRAYTFGPKKTPNWRKLSRRMLNGWIPIGDQAGILYGYGAIYKDVLKRTGSKEKAIQAFERYEGTQQTRSALYLTSVQMQKNAMSRLLLMFKSMPQLLFNKTFQSVVSMGRDFRAGGKPYQIRQRLSNIQKKDMRKFVVNHFVTNTLFQMVSYAPFAMFGDGDDYWKKVRRAAITGSLNGLFILGDVYDWAVGKRFAGEKYPLRITRTVEDLFGKPLDELFSGEKEKDLKEIVHAVGLFVSYYKGLPLHTLETIFKGITELGDGDITTGFLRMIGYTDYTVEKAAKPKKEKDEEDVSFDYLRSHDEQEKEAEKRWKWTQEEKDEPQDPTFKYAK